MSTISATKIFAPGNNSVRPIPFKAHKINEFSPEILEAHYENIYGATVRELNAIELEMAKIDIATIDDSIMKCNKEHEAQLINEILLHEVYFDSIGESGGQKLESESLMDAICASFSSVDEWRDEFQQLVSKLGNEDVWVVLAWSERLGRLLNLVLYDTTKGLFGVEPLITLDLYKHAYVDHFGDRPATYANSFLRNIDWHRVGVRFEAARSGNALALNEPLDHTQISVTQLNIELEKTNIAPLVIDVRHNDDRERYRKRVLKTDWRDSFRVDEWAHELPKDKPVVVYCMYGFWVSQKVAEELRAKGINARSLSGGVTAWQAMGYSSTDNEF